MGSVDMTTRRRPSRLNGRRLEAAIGPWKVTRPVRWWMALSSAVTSL